MKWIHTWNEADKRTTQHFSLSCNVNGNIVKAFKKSLLPNILLIFWPDPVPVYHRNKVSNFISIDYLSGDIADLKLKNYSNIEELKRLSGITVNPFLSQIFNQSPASGVCNSSQRFNIYLHSTQPFEFVSLVFYSICFWFWYRNYDQL